MRIGPAHQAARSGDACAAVTPFRPPAHQESGDATRLLDTLRAHIARLEQGHAQFEKQKSRAQPWLTGLPELDRHLPVQGLQRSGLHDVSPRAYGDQPAAIRTLVDGLERQEREQVLLGVTGSGKTFTMAKVIEAVQRPALILAPNKILAAQLYGEMKSFFPDNAVEYFVSYYDYYQPEAYVPRSDTYIEKESSVNEAIDRMRHSATRSLLERDDVIIIASVSCIYGIGSVETYSAMTFSLKKGGSADLKEVVRKLVAMQ